MTVKRPTRRQLWIAGTVTAAAAIIVLVARPERVSVEIAVAERGPLQVTVDEDGITRVRHHVEISAPVAGRLQEGLVEAGDTVVRGQVVARLLPAPLDARQREQAQAALQSARALRDEADARLAQARVTLGDAERSLERAGRLAQAGAISPRELESATDRVRLAERDLEAARARLAAATQDVRAAQTALVGADPARGAPPIPLRTSIAGRVLRVFEEHDRVVPAGTPLLEIGDPSRVEVIVDVLSSDAVGIRPGARVRVRVPQGRELRGHVTRVEPAAFVKLSPLGVEERRVNVIVELLEPAVGLGHQFEVDVSIVLWEDESVLRVPSTSLVPTDSTWAVFVVEEGRARLRQVEIGHRGAQQVEVVSGLSDGARVVRHPDERIRDGVRIDARTNR